MFDDVHLDRQQVTFWSVIKVFSNRKPETKNSVFLVSVTVVLFI